MAEAKETGQPNSIDVLTRSYFMEGNEELLLNALNISTTTKIMGPGPLTENVYGITPAFIPKLKLWLSVSAVIWPKLDLWLRKLIQC
jgi:hypothetical protein